MVGPPHDRALPAGPRAAPRLRHLRGGRLHPPVAEGAEGQKKLTHISHTQTIIKQDELTNNANSKQQP